VLQDLAAITSKSGCHKPHPPQPCAQAFSPIVCRNWIKGGPHSIEHQVICNSIYTTARTLLTVKSGFINSGMDLAVSEVRTELQPEWDPGQHGMTDSLHMTATTPLCVHALQLPHDWTLCAVRN